LRTAWLTSGRPACPMRRRFATRLSDWAMWTRSSARFEPLVRLVVCPGKRWRASQLPGSLSARCRSSPLQRSSFLRHPARRSQGSELLLLLMSELDRPVADGTSTAGRARRRSAEVICPLHAGALATSRAVASGADRDRSGRGRTCDRDPGLARQAIQDSQRLDGTNARTPSARTGRPHLQVAAHRPDRRVPPTTGRRQRAMRTAPSSVPRGMWFMMGDNRGLSDDSRFWGPIPGTWIIGDAFFTYWPPDRIGSL